MGLTSCAVHFAPNRWLFYPIGSPLVRHCHTGPFVYITGIPPIMLMYCVFLVAIWYLPSQQVQSPKRKTGYCDALGEEKIES